MLHLIQVINYMINTLEYGPDEVKDHFEAVLSGQITATELLEVLGLELSESAMVRFETAMPKYKSALAVINMKQETA